MKQRLYLFALIILTLAGVPFALHTFSDRPVVQSAETTVSSPSVYDNTLSPQWENWSWNSTINFESTNAPFAGDKTIEWNAQNYGGLYLHVKNNQSVQSALFESLEFSIKGTGDNQKMTVVVYDENNQPIGNATPLENVGGSVPNNTWKTYTISLQKLNPEMRNIKGIVLQSTMGNEQRVFVDELKFIPKPTAVNMEILGPNLPIYNDALSTQWENWSWDSTVIMNETYKTYTGTNSLAYTAHRPWSALYLHAKQPVNTSAYEAITFAVFASQPDQKFSIALLDSNNQLLKSPTPLANVGGDLTQNNWKLYRVPLQDLGAQNRTISGIILQESKGQAQPIIYIDSVALVGTETQITQTPAPTGSSTSTTLTPTQTAQKTTSTNSGNPFAGKSLYLDPNNNAKRTADELRGQGRNADADHMMKIANSPTAMWVVGGDPYSKVNDYVTRADAANSVPVIVSYNIPGRDCGQYSQGGTNYEGYKSYISQMANAIGNRQAVVILEPDALGLDCLQNENTYSLLRHAVETLESKANIAVYIEASTWVNPDTMADRLNKVSVSRAQGFAVNTSGYNTTDAMVDFGNKVSGKVGKHFVIDTSRNGRGAYDQSQPEPWCNPPDRALGNRPTGNTGHSNVDAYLWVKVPGESDGTCRGGPSAGSWWADYALGLAQRAGY